MGTISEESIKRVLEATDIVDLINSYIPLKRAGSAWKGVCPFHNDTRPSMTVNSVRQSFMCFACQTGGDALSFVMKYENIGFVDALRKLADRSGIILIEEKFDAAQEHKRKKIKTLADINSMAAGYFHQLLRKSPAAAHAREYLNARGYGFDMAQRWNIGWSPVESSEFLQWARARSIPPDLLAEAGLASANEWGGLYARFRDRLMFPICNDRGECVGFSGRLLREADNTGKYVNSPETAIFRKSRICFGLDRAQTGIRNAKKVLICEGQMDVIACHEAGVDFAVASQGTAFTPEHARLLKRRTNAAVICFDADAAGIKAADKAFVALAAEGMDVQIVRLPSGDGGKGDDPDSFIKREGAEAFRALVDQAEPFLASRIEWGRSSGRLRDASSSAAFALEISELVSSVKDPVARDLAASDAATRLQTGLDTMRRSVHQAAAENRPQRERDAADERPEHERAVRPMPVERVVLTLCQLALQDRTLLELIAERVEDLVEPMEQLAGGVILKEILAKMPDTSSAASIHAFIRTLPADQARAVEAMHLDPVEIKEPGRVVDEACSAMSFVALQKQYNGICAQLKNPELPEESRLALLKKSIDLRKLLTNITPRTP